MPNQLRSHEPASPSSDRVLDKETDTIKITPISVLPEDVLIKVIGIVSHPQGDQHPHDYVKRLHTMAQVCASWASIILHTPSLWSAIRFDADFGGTGWVTALRRSQHCRIAVECQSRTSPEPFWSTIVTHSHRWASLTVIVLQRSKWVRFTGVRAPFLKELRLSMSGEQLDIDREAFPNVSTVALSGVALQDWSCGLLSGLRSLYLYLGNPSVHPPSLQQLLDMLAASPRLEDLRIHSMASVVDNASIRWPLISLPALRNITFEYLPAIAVDVILQSIHATHCSVLSSAPGFTLSQQLNIGGENLPDVSSLSLRNVGLGDWSSGLLSGLRFLSLSVIPAFSPSLQQLLDILAASPRLGYLKLSNMAPAIDSTCVRRPLIPLCDLRDLCFDSIPAVVVDVVLQSVHAAYCPIVDLYHGSQSTPAQSLFPTIASFVTPSLYRYFTTAREPITLTPWGNGFKFAIDSEKYVSNARRTFSIAIRSFSIDTDAMIKWVDSLIESKMSNPHPPHLTVSLFEKETVDRVCASKWRLAHVEVIELREQGAELCRFLSSPIDLGHGRYGWPGPDVRKIVFDNSPGLDAEVVLEMVKRRMAASSLAPLVELVITGRSSIVGVQLVEFKAGKEKMTCEGLMEAVKRIIAAGTCGSSDRDIAKQGSLDNVNNVVIAG
ncbi:hypothetical protein FRB95_000489 [Tulasnella sp. JGI-2019a]|nr:hypothetical protein FRB95_000489 [Tulasnella sp. JGI-2019a]